MRIYNLSHELIILGNAVHLAQLCNTDDERVNLGRKIGTNESRAIMEALASPSLKGQLKYKF
jgi:hypothetical protein